MSRPLSPIVCDGPGCGKQKAEANRWWQAVIQDPVKSGGKFRLCLYDADEERTNADWAGWIWHDFCGETCVLKFISGLMGKVTS